MITGQCAQLIGSLVGKVVCRCLSCRKFLPEGDERDIADLEGSALESIKRIDIRAKLNQPFCDLVTPLTGCQMPVQRKRLSYAVWELSASVHSHIFRSTGFNTKMVRYAAALTAAAVIVGMGALQRCSLVIVTAICI